MSTHRDLRGTLARLIVVGVAYFLAARLGAAFVVESVGISVFWPPAGLLLGYLLITERRNWPAALTAAFTATVVAKLALGKASETSIGFGIVDALEPAAGAWAIRRFRPGAFRLRSARDLCLLFGIPGVVCAGAALGAAAFAAASSDVSFWKVWEVWWLADALGVVLFAPLVVCWADRPPGRVERRGVGSVIEAGAILSVLAALSLYIFAVPAAGKPLLLNARYPVFPVLLWVAIRFDGRGTAVAVVLVSLIAVGGAVRAFGPVAGHPPAAADQVLVIQGFCAVASLSAFLLTVAISERRQREREILALNDSLRVGLAERQVALEQLRSQKQIFETVLDSLGEAVLVTNTAGEIVLQNRAFRTLHTVPQPGAPAEWSHVQGVYRADGKTLCPVAELPIFRAARGESSDNVPLVIVDPAHPEGRPVSVTGRPLVGPGGIEGGVITIRDVSELHRAELERQASERRYRLLVDGVRDYAIYLLDPLGRVASWNVGAARLKGYSEAEIVGKHISTFYPPEDVAAGKMERVLRIATETGQYEEQGWRVRKDGSRFWANVVITALHDSDGHNQGFAKATRDLTDRREAERALVESEQRFRAIFDQTFQFVGLMSADGTLLEANRTALAATGIAEEQVIGEKFWDTPWWSHDAAQQDRLRDAVGRAARGETVRFEAFHLAPDGGKVWVDFSLKPFIADGRVVYLIPEGRDVTDRKNTELALEESAAFNRGILDALSATITVVDRAGVITATNRPWDQFTRDNPAPHPVVARTGIGTSYLDVCDRSADRGCPEARAVAAGLRSVLAGGGPWSGLEYECHAPTERRWFAVSVTPLKVGGGAVVCHTNVTARRRAEDAVRESEDRFRTVFESAPIGMALVGPDGRWLRVNRAVCELLGYTPDELLVVDFQTVTHPDDLGADVALVHRTLGGTIPCYQMEKRYFHKRGHIVHTLLSVSLVRDGSDEPLYFIAQIVDISQRKRAEEALAANEALLEQFVRHAPVAIAMFDTQMRYVRTSDQWMTDYQLTGQEIIGRSHYDVFPDTPEYWKEIHRRVLDGAVESCAEDPFPRPDGGTEWLQWEARPWHEPGGAIGGLIFFTQVITERVHVAQRAVLLHTATRVLVEAASMADAVVGLIRTACEARGWAVGEFWQLTGDGAALAFAGGWAVPEADGFVRSSSGLTFAPGDGLPGRVWVSRSPHVIADLAADPGFRRREAAAQHGLRCGIAFPLVVGDRVVGVFDFLVRQTRPPSAEDIALLDGLAMRLGQWVERKEAESALVASEARFRTVFDASPSGLLLVRCDGRIALANDLIHRLFVWEKDELLGAPVERLVPDCVRDRHLADRAAYFAAPTARAIGGPLNLTGRRKDGTEFPVEIGLTPVHTEGELFVLATVVDITERKRTEEALRMSEERLRLALGNARHGLWDWDVASGTVHYDAVWATVHGYELDEVVFDYAWWERSIHPDDRTRVLAALNLHLASDALYDVEYRARRKDGSWIWLNTRGRVQTRDPDGRAVRMMGTLHDISERKRTESVLLKSVHEKEVMLREIHHRVKNNLAVISSLFHLQAGSVQDEKTAKVLREAQDRVRSMALVHEHLYNSADLGSVAFGEYAKILATQIIQTYRLPSTPVELETVIGDAALTIEQAIPCGLILNELLSNCLKHAFRDRPRGKVVLTIAATAGACEIRVADDGVGVPPGLDVRLGKSLGVRLVRILTRQLVGTVEYLSPGVGTEVKLVFPIQAPRKN